LFGIRKYRWSPVKAVFGEISEISAGKKNPAPSLLSSTNKILVPDRKKIPRGVGIAGYRGHRTNLNLKFEFKFLSMTIF
jgi:hypothetical protein